MGGLWRTWHLAEGVEALGREGALSAAPCSPAFPMACPPVKTFLDLGIVGTSVPTGPTVSALNSLHHQGLCDGSRESVSSTRQAWPLGCPRGLVPGQAGRGPTGRH